MKKIFYTITAVVLCLTACQKEMTENQPVVIDPEMATVTVPFTVTIPVSPEAVTRAGERYVLDMEEPVINNLYIAVFGENGGMLQQLVPATLVGETLDHAGFAYKCEYKAQLPLYDEECHLHFIGNYNGDISTLNFDREKPFMDNLSTTIVTTEYTEGEGDSAKTYHPITLMPDAYWQKVVLEDGIKATYNPDSGQFELDDETKEKLNPIALVRNYAKITVTSASTDFTINSYALVNVPRQGSVAPWQAPEKTKGFSNIFMEIGKYCDGTYDTDLEHKDDPAYPNFHNFVEDVYDSGYSGYMVGNDLNSIFTDNPGESSAKYPRDTDNGLYMYERTEPTKAGEQTGIIVCLTWNENLPRTNENYPYRGQTMYYKIEVLDEEGEYMPILRNIHYKFSLTKLSGEGEPTFDKAFDGAFFGNVSASIETATLNSINNNRQQIVVNRMDVLSVTGEDVVPIYFQFYPEMTGSPSSNPANYEVNQNSILTVDGYAQAIASVGNIEYINDSSSDWNGWMRVLVTLKEKPVDGSTLRGKLRVKGVLDSGVGSLYRDIVFTVMSKQDFTSDSKVTVDGNDVTVTIGLPAELPYSIFPLHIRIEARDNNLSTSDADLPVGYGPTAFTDYAAKQGKNSFYFIRTIQYKEYVNTDTGEYVYKTKYDCPFTLTNNGTVVVRLTEEGDYFNAKPL